jgi:hypothetical protein
MLNNALKPVEGCPHKRVGPEEAQPGTPLILFTCQDCGTTLSRPRAAVSHNLKEKVHALQDEIFDEDRVIALPVAFDDRTFYSSEFPQEVGHKPYGLWYGCGGDWLDRIAFGEKSSGKHYVYLLELDESDLLVINSDSQLKAFSKKFSLGPYDVNWPQVAEKYTGIEISPFLYRVAGELDWYYPWDVASGCIWEPSAVLSVDELVLP